MPLKEFKGEYADRANAYKFAVMQSFNLGIFRKNSPVIELGCGDPYANMLKFLRAFAWDGVYCGIDTDLPAYVTREAEGDDDAIIVTGARFDADSIIPFPPTPDNPIKEFAVAFSIFTLDYLTPERRRHFVEEMQRVSAQIFVIGANPLFEGVRTYDEPVALYPDELKEYGFQHIGFVNFNGRPSKTHQPYPRDNGTPEQSSEIYGIWYDDMAYDIVTQERRPPRGYAINESKKKLERVDLTEEQAREVINATR